MLKQVEMTGWCKGDCCKSKMIPVASEGEAQGCQLATRAPSIYECALVIRGKKATVDSADIPTAPM